MNNQASKQNQALLSQQLLSQQLFSKQLADAIARISRLKADPFMLQKSIALLLSELAKGNTSLNMQTFCNKVGHHCAQSWEKQLIEQEIAAQAPAFAPMIIDQGKLYLGRYYHYHAKLQQQLKHLANHCPEHFDKALISASLAKYFPKKENAIVPNWQKIAATLVLKKQFCVISGGPGTGKTTTVLRLLATLSEVCGKDLQIKLAAPTGKAAMRMQESIRNNLADLQKLGCSEKIIQQLDASACTLHRLLGYQQNSIYFRHHANNPLSLDVLVIDESSMIDSAMMVKLLDAIPETARVILLGDKDQLAAVEPGNPFSQMCQQFGFSQAFANELFADSDLSESSRDKFINNAPQLLSDNIVFLHHSYRFGSDSGIGQLAKAVNHNDYKRALQLMKSQKYSDILWQDYKANDFRHYQAILPDPLVKRLKSGFSAYRNSLKQPSNLDTIFKAYQSFCVLAAVKRGYSGIEDINSLVEEKALNLKPKTQSIWYHGRPIMITQNDYQTGLFNGDVGICLELEKEQGLRVYFPTTEGYKNFIPSRVPHHQTAYAITVHKSQGSEFAEVLFILPDGGARVLNKSLVYTAITRAKDKVELWGNSEVWEMQEA